MTHDGEPDSYEYASRLATWIWEKHYKNESPHWKPLNDLLGVLTQIDNMVTGLVRAQPEQEIDSDRPHVENDGCPTEKAVLQRFWREHQKQEPVAQVDYNERGNISWLFGPQLPDKTFLYTAPPQREWQGLTDEEVRLIVQGNTDAWCDTPETDGYGVAEMVEAKLKEKNS